MAAKLIMTLDGAILKEFIIDKEAISIGRRVGNDIQVNDMTVSGRHALVTTLGKDSFVEDLGTTNGTMVNGNYINKLLLMHGDIMQIGTHQFTYFAEEEAEYEPTMFIKAEMDDTRMMPQSEALTDDMKGMPLGAVKILNGPSSNTVMEMRKPFNTLGFKGMKLASVARGIHGYTIQRIKASQSKRETDIPMLNGERLGDDIYLLSEHDIIEIAGFQMEFIYLH
jgi:hypothetical protein